MSKRQLANEAIYIEQERIRENVGSQDQTAAAYGGFNIIEFSEKDITVVPCIDPEATRILVSSNLVMIYTGISRIASEIVSEQIKTLDKKLDELEQIKGLVDTAIQMLTHGAADDFSQIYSGGITLRLMA